MTTPKKRPLLSALKSVFQNPLVRGTIKSLPLGNWAYEVAENIRHAKNPDTRDLKAPHSALSLLAQAVFLGLIIYAFSTGQLTIADVLRYVIPDDFKNFGIDPLTGVSPDSLGI